MKVLVATEKPFVTVAIRQIREVVESAGYTLQLLESYKSPADLIAAVADAEALIVRSDLVTAEVLNAAPKLRIVVRAGAGYDNIDLPAATKAGVVAMNTPGQNSNAVVELAFGMMIYQIRTQFSGASGTELMGKTLGLIGAGNIGTELARRALAFGMRVIAHDPLIRSHALLQLVTLEQLLGQSDYLSLHVPLTDETPGMINAGTITKMKDGPRRRSPAPRAGTS